MKRLHTGLILLDGIDIICISVSAGSLLGYGFKRYRNYKIGCQRTEKKISILKKVNPQNCSMISPKNVRFLQNDIASSTFLLKLESHILYNFSFAFTKLSSRKMLRARIKNTLINDSIFLRSN